MIALKTLVKKPVVWGGMATLLVVGGMALRPAPEAVQEYALASVQKQTLVVSLSGSGQVAGESELSVRSTVAGKLVSVLVKPTAAVKAGDILATIDAKEAQKTIRDAAQSVRDASLSLESASIALRKVQEPPEASALLQAKNSVSQAERALATIKKGAEPIDIEQAEQAYTTQAAKVAVSLDGKTPSLVRDAYDDAVPTLRTTSQSVQAVLRNMEEVFKALGEASIDDSYAFRQQFGALDPEHPESGDTIYHAAQREAKSLKQQVDGMRSFTEDATKIDRAMQQAQTTLALMVPLTQKMDEFLTDLMPTQAVTQTSITTFKAQARSDKSDMVSRISTITNTSQAVDQAKRSLQSEQASAEKLRIAWEKLRQGPDVNDVASAEERVAEAKAALAKLQEPPSALDLATARNTVEQRRSALATAQARLADAQAELAAYTIRAPFDGVVAAVDVKANDEVSASTQIAKLITNTKLVSISLNEVDVATVRQGQKATVTFDALPELEIAGIVSQVDVAGTASQGVVTYAVKIGFLTQDERVKSGMSASVTMMTDVRPEVLTVPNSAITQRNGNASVLVVPSSTQQTSGVQGVVLDVAPEARIVQLGASNDTITEIVSGLQEGEQIVSRTLAPTAAAPASSARQTGAAGASSLRVPGLGGATGGGFRP